MPSSSYSVRWAGLAAMLGGTIWVVETIIHASKPRGCIGQECAFRPLRESGALDSILMLSSVLLLAVGLIGLVILARSSGALGRTAKTGIAVGVTGAWLLMIASLMQAVFYRGDFPLMPAFIIPGVLALVAGFLLLGLAILRAGVLPRWVGVLFIAGTLAMLGVNEQTALVLMAIPFGIAWVAVGYALWSGRKGVAEQAARVS